MLFTWLIVGVLIGGVFVALLEQIRAWAEHEFNGLVNTIKKAWVYIRRIPGGIKQMLRYIRDGRMYEKESDRVVEKEKWEEMYNDGTLNDDEYNQLVAGDELKIASIERDR